MYRHGLIVSKPGLLSPAGHSFPKSWPSPTPRIAKDSIVSYKATYQSDLINLVFTSFPSCNLLTYFMASWVPKVQTTITISAMVCSICSGPGLTIY
jgi:hypothetical protein